MSTRGTDGRLRVGREEKTKEAVDQSIAVMEMGVESVIGTYSAITIWSAG